MKNYIVRRPANTTNDKPLLKHPQVGITYYTSTETRQAMYA
jgi:hypothetical protein